MPTYVAMLRGINVSGHNQIKMPVLRDLFEGLGHADVATYIQSGNVVFTSAADEVARSIEERITADLGLSVVVILRTVDELADALAGNPFPAADLARLHITFLAGPADASGVARLDGFESPPDEFVTRGREVYLHCPEGYGRSRLNNAFWERRLKVAATTRNWKTVTKLAELASPQR